MGDSLDNALTETTIGLYKTECVSADSPFPRGPIRILADLEEITSAWVHWYNTRRLMHRLGRIPPAEAETAYYATIDAATPRASQAGTDVGIWSVMSLGEQSGQRAEQGTVCLGRARACDLSAQDAHLVAQHQDFRSLGSRSYEERKPGAELTEDQVHKS